MPIGLLGGRMMTASTSAFAGRIFISYRQIETAYHAGWLFDRLVEHFGEGQVFKDVDSIPLGDDFVEVITDAVGSCDVLLALIGRQWLTVTDQARRRRLDNPDDFVRLEIEAALKRRVRVIPILVDGVPMPQPEELPASLAKLAHRRALELSPSRFGVDTARLLSELDRTLTKVPVSPTVKAHDTGARGSMEVVDDALPIRTLRRQSIALLGPRGAGKTTLATFLHSGEMPQGYQPTVLRSTFMVKGAFLRTLLLLFSLLFGARIKNLPHRLTILDNPGMTPQGVEAVSKLWLQSARSVKNVLYLVDVSKLSNRKYCDMAVNCAREITRWDLGDRRKLLILTHTDLDPAGKSGNFDEISSRKTVDDLRRGLHADDVIMGSQKDYRDTRQLAYHVLQFLALSGWTPCLQRMRAGWPDLACRR